jgi:outer membrane biosynthesis protein TonB
MVTRLSTWLFLLCVLASSSAAHAVTSKSEKYEVALTKHITLHQKYPTSGKMYGLEGDVIVRIQLDREGNYVGHMFVHEKTHPVLKQAVDDMIAASSPAPKPPIDYFGENEDIIEFMLPIAFRTPENANNLAEIDRLFQQKKYEAWN